jgi:hypothetical protein
MEDQFSKYIKLFNTLVVSFVAFVVALLLVFLGLRLIFGVLNQISWLTYLYTAVILILPAVLFIVVYLIFWKRTKLHPSKPVAALSKIVFAAALCSWIVVLVLDAVMFTKKGYSDVYRYKSFDLLFLIAHVTLIFLIGVIQALSMPAEKDWMQRGNSDEKAG